jgi:uracil-DNA glycosylase family 4
MLCSVLANSPVLERPVLSVEEQCRHTVRQLRWLLTGYDLSGLRHWTRQASTPAALPAEDAEAPSDRGVALQFQPPANPEQELALILEQLGDCHRCRLHATRTQIVFADGSPLARLVFVGEAPGYDEDRQGRPFVGRAGQLLDKMIEALGRRRQEVYICNVVKCRPPENRNPDLDEVAACSPFLIQQLEAIQPRVICALGTFAAQTLLQTRQPISQLRGKVRLWRGMPVIATFHPAYLLRNSAHKALAWQDLLQVLDLLNKAPGIGEDA